VKIFAGGSAPQANQSETAVVDLWNHVTGEWTRAELSQPRKKPEAVSVGGKIIIAGGEVAKPPRSTQLSSAAAATAAGAAASLKGYTAVVDIFDSATGLWSTAEMLQARQYFGATAATDELAVFAGGFFNDVVGTLPPVPAPLSGHTILCPHRQLLFISACNRDPLLLPEHAFVLFSQRQSPPASPLPPPRCILFWLSRCL